MRRRHHRVIIHKLLLFTANILNNVYAQNKRQILQRHNMHFCCPRNLLAQLTNNTAEVHTMTGSNIEVEVVNHLIYAKSNTAVTYKCITDKISPKQMTSMKQ